MKEDNNNCNIVYIVLDAFCYRNLKLKIGSKEITPFLNKLTKENSLSFDNMFALAPYTEASQVSLLGNEKPLENGGYLLGNKNCSETLFERYKKNGYSTFFTYSPYVYSSSYLRGVDKYFYTRLFNIGILFSYRLNYFKKKYISNKLAEKEINICIILLDEAFNTWISQCNSILKNEEESSLINNMIADINVVKNTLDELNKEKKEYNKEKKEYINDIFKEFESHKLRKLGKKYKDNLKELYLEKSCRERYLSKMKKYQKRYSNILKNQKIDFKYLFGILFNEKSGLKEGLRKFIRLIKKYRKYFFNKDLINYLYEINKNSKEEVSFHKILDKFYEIIIKNDDKNNKYFSFIHVQDFHLPSVFHSYDSTDEKIVDKEFRMIFDILEELNNDWKGNIIAALSARYCDFKLEEFFYKLKNDLKNDFIFVVTADHGYPLYQTPPRAETYNQLYNEAFEIPCIIYNKNIITEQKKGMYSIIDGFKFLDNISGVDNSEIKERDYILCEYGGPGCPAIYEKEIWYTLITKDINISFECSLNSSIDFNSIKTIYDLKNDAEQKFNLLKKYDIKKLEKYISIVNKRHEELKEKYLGDKFFSSTLI